VSTRNRRPSQTFRSPEPVLQRVSTEAPLDPGLAALPVSLPLEDREALEQAIRDERYEEALDLLYRDRALVPGDPAISRSIRVLEEELMLRYGHEIGDLDRIPMPVRRASPADLTLEQQQVLRLVDGLATFGDVLQSSDLGRYETYRALALMLERGLIGARAPSFTTPLSLLQASRLPPPAGPRPRANVEPPPPPAPPEDEYEQLFERATDAYLGLRFDVALRLYEACLARRPDDGRVTNNLIRLRRRV